METNLGRGDFESEEERREYCRQVALQQVEDNKDTDQEEEEDDDFITPND